MADGGDNHVRVFREVVSSIVSLHSERLCVNVNYLDDSSLSLFVDFATDYAKFGVTMAQIIDNVLNVGIIVRAKHAMALQQMEAVIRFY